MKKIELGIALLLFGILLQSCMGGFETVSLLCGAAGLGSALWGYFEEPKKSE